jgi:peptidyl-tRNA hydrolase
MDKLSSYLNSDTFFPFATGVFVGVSTVLVCYKIFRRPSSAANQLSSFNRMAKLTKIRAQNLGRNHKMVFVVRTDLGMGKGKIAAQCSHAAIACYQRAQEADQANLDIWEATGCTKICLKFEGNEVDLKKLEAKARGVGLITGLIADAGHTQIARGSHTVLGIGPAPVSRIDEITGHLKLL